jgi:hypothetical protein
LAEEELAELLAADVLALRGRVDAVDRRLEDVEGVVSEKAELLETTQPDFMLSPWWWPALLTISGARRQHWRALTTLNPIYES